MIYIDIMAGIVLEIYLHKAIRSVANKTGKTKGGDTMENLFAWITELNKTDHTAFAILTVVTMSGIGLVIGSTIELFFKVLGIKTNKIEIHH
ncbi:MAG: hypothetical protein H7843_12845 [Nitrospirota bacterium]